MDIAPGEAVEQQLDILIEIRHDRRVVQEGVRPAAQAWAESVRRHNARIHEENKAAWAAYHQGQAERHRRSLQNLVDHHEALAALLQATDERDPT